MGLFERLGKSNAKKQTYEAMSRAQQYGHTPETAAAQEKELKEAVINGVFFQLQMKLTSNLLKSLNREDLADKEAAMHALKKDIDERMQAFRKMPSEKNMLDLQEWALSKTHVDFYEPVGKAFADLREDLILQGVAL